MTASPQIPADAPGTAPATAAADTLMTAATADASADAAAATSGLPLLHWVELDQARSAPWRSEAGVPPPKRVQVADERLPPEVAYKLICEGTALLWRGDYHRAKDLLQALAVRVDGKKAAAGKPGGPGAGKSGGKPGAGGKGAPAGKAKAQAAAQGASAKANVPASAAAAASAAASAPGASGAALNPATQAFHLERQARGRRARLLNMLLLPVDTGHRIDLRRAPDVSEACEEAWGPSTGPCVVSLRELLGLIGAHEWRKAGIEVTQLGNGARIHAHYGVFSPVRNEYLSLIAKAPLPKPLLAKLQHPGPEEGGEPLPADQAPRAFDIGTGTGVIAALLAHRGVPRVVATDLNERALACARENVERLGGTEAIHVVKADLFPAAEEGLADLIVCNPPWVPARPSSALELAVYDPDSAMLRGFLAGLAARLAPGGQGWLILSDLAEHLGLRSRDELLAWIRDAGLRVAGRLDIRPRHPRVNDQADPLHAARAAEVTSLWQLEAGLVWEGAEPKAG